MPVHNDERRNFNLTTAYLYWKQVCGKFALRTCGRISIISRTVVTYSILLKNWWLQKKTNKGHSCSFYSETLSFILRQITWWRLKRKTSVLSSKTSAIQRRASWHSCEACGRWQNNNWKRKHQELANMRTSEKVPSIHCQEAFLQPIEIRRLVVFAARIHVNQDVVLRCQLLHAPYNVSLKRENNIDNQTPLGHHNRQLKHSQINDVHDILVLFVWSSRQ